MTVLTFQVCFGACDSFDVRRKAVEKERPDNPAHKRGQYLVLFNISFHLLTHVLRSD
jgi:hypothetical protein